MVSIAKGRKRERERGQACSCLTEANRIKILLAGSTDIVLVFSCRLSRQSAVPILDARAVSAKILQLSRAVRTIFSSPSGDAGASFEDLYHAVDAVVVFAQKGDELYERVRMEMERAVGDVARSLRAGASADSQAAEKDGEGALQDEASLGSKLTWLRQLCDAWLTWCDRTSLVCNIFALLDRAYAVEHRELLPLWDLGLDLFKMAVAANDELSGRALACIASACNSERRAGTGSFRTLHVALLPMWTTLGIYDALERALLVATREYYTIEAPTAIASMAKAAYLAHVQAYIQLEEGMGAWLYANESGRHNSVEIVHNEMIKAHAAGLVDGLPDLLVAAETPALTLLYESLGRVRELAMLRTAFGMYVRKHGEEIALDKENEDKLVERLLEYKGVIDKIVVNAFKDDGDFRQTQKESFEQSVNKRENKTAELIAKFLDTRLRSGNKTMSDQEMEHMLNETLILFRYCHAKDMFEEFYKRLFAKRLLLNRSASSDAEQSMLLKLKEECGPAFTQKLETMLTDISLSDEMMQGYAAMRTKSEESDAFELNVNVLTQAHWPTYPQTHIIIPPAMSAATGRFSDFYETRNQGRKLHWAHSLGTTSLTAQFGKAGEKELLVSEFQTVVLLLFNDLAPGTKLSFRRIKELTELEDKELKRTLQSLACGQIPTRVLRKDPQGKDVNEDDEFLVNEALKNERKRIRINMIQLNETQEEQKSTVDRVMFDRELVLQATAVRILKAKKTIKHAELLQEIVQQIASRFTVDVAEIKKTFEILIDKEYMERVEGQRGMYQYLA